MIVSDSPNSLRMASITIKIAIESSTTKIFGTIFFIVILSNSESKNLVTIKVVLRAAFVSIYNLIFI
ncbi:hypothetical protein PCA01_38550 [Pseudoalteromonas carrageenovora]|nr:hypothetical protein PCA01_38550 [Pseudoalteromonas carrageenovora]